MLEEVLLVGRSQHAATLGRPLSASVDPSRSLLEARTEAGKHTGAESEDAMRCRSFQARLPSQRKRLLRGELFRALRSIGIAHAELLFNDTDGEVAAEQPPAAGGVGRVDLRASADM